MDFTLNLKVVIKENLNTELSSESCSILALVKFFELKPNIDFNCFCFYTDADLNKKNNALTLIENGLNESFPDFRFVNESQDFRITDKYSHIIIKSLNLNLNPEYLHDTSLPSLVNFISNDSYMVITGLSSVYRFIVKVAHNYKPAFQFQNLLVNMCALCSFYFYQIDFFLNKRVTEIIVLKLVQKFRTGLIFVK